MSNTRRPRNPQLAKPQRSTSTAVVVGLVVAVCIAAIVVVAVVLNDDDKASTASPSSSSSSGPLESCSAAPATPGKGQQFDEAPDKGLAKDATWIATVTTNCGDITMELDGAKAPETVSSFIFLAQQGYFDDSPCHRLTTSGLFVLQCGDPTGEGTGGPGYGFGIENPPADGLYPRGTLAMARSSSPDSNGSQFFFVYKDSTLPTEGGGYSIFGMVTSGLDIVDAIAKQGVTGGGSDGAPAQPISILDVSVEEQS